MSSAAARRGGELERLRLENETLSSVVGLIASGPDLAHILDRVVDLLTRATDCHACFVYLRAGDQLELRAASPIFSHLIGRISFGVDSGLTGWSIRNEEPAFIRDGAIQDPRTHYVPELEEEKFQSMVAVPIPSRGEAPIGSIVLHTVAPREFDERILNVLSRAASLVAGAIENARLYEEARERVDELTRLSALGREIAAVADRASLFALAARGIRDLVGADVCRIYRAEGPGGSLSSAAAVPPAADESAGVESALAAALADAASGPDEVQRLQMRSILDLGGDRGGIDAAPLVAGAERFGAVVVGAEQPLSTSARELLRAAAQQVSLALQKIDLIERLTEENLARDLFAALDEGQLDAAAGKAVAANISATRPHFVLEARPGDGAGTRAGGANEAERALKGQIPKSFCDVSTGYLRAVVPVAEAGAAPVRKAIERLADDGRLRDLAIGASEARVGLDGLALAAREAGDAARISTLLGELDRPLLYRDSGAYRYLIDLLDSGGPRDHLQAAVATVSAYDRERGAELLRTLDEYLSRGGSVAATARDLYIHVNTLRQRLQRIEELTGLEIAAEDRLALQLAVRLGLVERPEGQG